MAQSKAQATELTLTYVKDTSGKVSGGHRVFAITGNGVSYGQIAFPRATAPDAANPNVTLGLIANEA